MYFQHKANNKNNVITQKISKIKSNNNNSRLINFLLFDFKNMLHPNKEFSTKSALLALIISVTHITAACYLLAECVIKIAEFYQMATFFVACIIAAIATSISDTIISVKDAINKNYDDAISNAIGSNIFDVCICLGIPLIIYTAIYGPIILLPHHTNSYELRFLLFVLTILVICLLLIPKRVGIITGCVLFCGYILSAIFIWSKGMNVAWAKKIGLHINKLLF